VLEGKKYIEACIYPHISSELGKNNATKYTIISSLFYWTGVAVSIYHILIFFFLKKKTRADKKTYGHSYISRLVRCMYDMGVIFRITYSQN
jgi:Sec-independent protein secretion pathway component TatC